MQVFLAVNKVLPQQASGFSYQVYTDTTLTIRSLDKDQQYWFAVDAFGENGVTPGKTLMATKQ